MKAIPNTSDNEILEDVWWRILEEYTDRELTYPKVDKLAALSGIATRMGIAMDDVYVAGHFWKTLPYRLNWQVQPAHRSNKSIADTEAYALTPVDETNLAGQIVSAVLKIRAYCTEIEWTQGRPVILSESWTWSDDVYFLMVNIDYPNDWPADGTRYWLATLAEDDWLGK